MTLESYLDIIINFLKDYLEDNKQQCYILGLSGGVDSSLVAAIGKKAVGKDKLFTYSMPIDSLKDDEDDAYKLANILDINFQVLDLSKPYHEMIKIYEDKNIQLDMATKANLKARLRMATLFAIAQNKKGLVLGTDNKDERYTGYFTKFGDGAADLLPIAHLIKKEVRDAALLLDVPAELANRVPSAGLYEGQKDEDELKVTYDELDAYLLGKNVSETAKQRIEYLHKISEHKRKDIPTPMEFIRDGK